MTAGALFGGIEGGGTKFICAVGTGPDNIRAEILIPTTSPEETLNQTTKFFKLQETRFGEISSIEFACFGPLDPNPASPAYGQILPTPKPGWSNVNVVRMICDIFDILVIFDTDVNGAVMGNCGGVRHRDSKLSSTSRLGPALAAVHMWKENCCMDSSIRRWDIVS